MLHSLCYQELTRKYWGILQHFQIWMFHRLITFFYYPYAMNFSLLTVFLTLNCLWICILICIIYNNCIVWSVWMFNKKDNMIEKKLENKPSFKNLINIDKEKIPESRSKSKSRSNFKKKSRKKVSALSPPKSTTSIGRPMNQL